MTIRVEFDDFADTVVRQTGKREAYLQTHDSVVALTGADPKSNVVVRCEVIMEPGAAKRALEHENFLVLPGEWEPVNAPLAVSISGAEAAVAAVAYEAVGHKAGLWMDAYAHIPSDLEVMEAMFTELKTNGEIPDISLEKFVEDISPNVVILTPDQIAAYLAAKTGHAE